MKARFSYVSLRSDDYRLQTADDKWSLYAIKHILHDVMEGETASFPSTKVDYDVIRLIATHVLHDMTFLYEKVLMMEYMCVVNPDHVKRALKIHEAQGLIDAVNPSTVYNYEE